MRTAIQRELLCSPFCLIFPCAAAADCGERARRGAGGGYTEGTSAVGGWMAKERLRCMHESRDSRLAAQTSSMYRTVQTVQKYRCRPGLVCVRRPVTVTPVLGIFVLLASTSHLGPTIGFMFLFGTSSSVKSSSCSLPHSTAVNRTRAHINT